VNTSARAAHHGFDLHSLAESATGCITPNDSQYRWQGIELFSTFVKTHAPPAYAHYKRFGHAVRSPSCCCPLEWRFTNAPPRQHSFQRRFAHALVAGLPSCLPNQQSWAELQRDGVPVGRALRHLGGGGVSRAGWALYDPELRMGRVIRILGPTQAGWQAEAGFAQVGQIRHVNVCIKLTSISAQTSSHLSDKWA
jgi:hypothetical protein